MQSKFSIYACDGIYGQGLCKRAFRKGTNNGFSNYINNFEMINCAVLRGDQFCFIFCRKPV
jgi:hypothetical protein